MKKNTPPYLVLQLEADLNENDDVQFLNSVTDGGKALFRSLFVALPFTRMEAMAGHFPDSGIHFGATQLNDCTEGSFTAPIAAGMVKNAGGQFVLVGARKEKACLKGTIQDKLSRAFEQGLKVVFCLDGQEDLAQQCALLDPRSPFFDDPHPLVVYQPQLTALKEYLPSKEELVALHSTAKEAISAAWKDKASKVSLIVQLPSDLSGFSSLLEGTPFDGLFCIKSGIYPHAVQEELVTLAKVLVADIA
jgi:hypothetical protein